MGKAKPNYYRKHELGIGEITKRPPGGETRLDNRHAIRLQRILDLISEFEADLAKEFLRIDNPTPRESALLTQQQDSLNAIKVSILRHMRGRPEG